MSAKDEVMEASEQFYVALNRMLNGDAEPMAEVWSRQADSTSMHPVGGREVGWREVRESWEEIAAISSHGSVGLDDQLIRVAGEMAYELGVEKVEANLAGEEVSGEIRVTNIYRRENGKWKMVHHHTDIDPEMVQVLEKK